MIIILWIIGGIAAWQLLGCIMLAAFLPEEVAKRFIDHSKDDLIARNAAMIACSLWPVTLVLSFKSGK